MKTDDEERETRAHVIESLEWEIIKAQREVLFQWEKIRRFKQRIKLISDLNRESNE